MNRKLVCSMPIFKYQDLTEKLRGEILSTTSGDCLPSQNEIMRTYQVSNRTASRALQTLCDEGLIAKGEDAKTFVASPAPKQGSLVDSSSRLLTGSVVVLTLARNPFFRHCVDSLVAQCTRRGLNVFCQYATRDDIGNVNPFGVAELKPDGFVMFSYRFEPIARALQQQGHRVVIVGVSPLDTIPTLPCVSGDQQHGGILAAERLLSLGHRRIGFLHDFTDNHQLWNTRRWRGHVQALEQYGIDIQDQVVYNGMDRRDFVRNTERFVQVLNRPEAPTAYVVWTDAEAAEWIKMMNDAGKKVPGDISLIGYDGVLLGSLIDPPLDTIDAHIAAQVGYALDLLLGEELGTTVPYVSVTPSLLVRASCAPASKTAFADK